MGLVSPKNGPLASKIFVNNGGVTPLLLKMLAPFVLNTDAPAPSDPNMLNFGASNYLESVLIVSLGLSSFFLISALESAIIY